MWIIFYLSSEVSFFAGQQYYYIYTIVLEMVIHNICHNWNIVDYEIHYYLIYMYIISSLIFNKYRGMWSLVCLRYQ